MAGCGSLKTASSRASMSAVETRRRIVLRPGFGPRVLRQPREDWSSHLSNLRRSKWETSWPLPASSGSANEDVRGVEVETSMTLPSPQRAGEKPMKRVWARPVCEITAEADPGLNQEILSPGSSISHLWTQDMWERHRQVNRYWRHVTAVPQSTVFLRVLEPVLVITASAMALAAWNTIAPSLWALPPLSLSPITHSVSGSLLSLMLVFRTNNANARVNEARSLLATMVKCIRDLVRMSQYIPQQTGACREQILCYTRAFPYALLGHIRKGRAVDSQDGRTTYRVDPLPPLTRILGPEIAQDLISQRSGNIPAHILLDMSTILHKSLRIGMSTQIHQQTELVLKELSHVTASAEKLLSTPIPVSYTRHTSRTLITWLATLPLVLWPVLGWTMIPAVFVITWLMIGVDECGVQLEEPFCILPAQPLCKMLDEEVGEMLNQALAAEDFKPAPKK